AGCSSSPGSSVTVVVNTPDMTAVHETSCVPAEVGVFTNVYTNQNGCDSTVVLTVTYQSFDETFVDETTCDPAMAGVFTETFTNQNGCDSVVVTTVSLLSPNECNVSFQLAAAVIPCGSNEGSISIEVELGQFPLAYNYSGTGGSGSGSVTSSPFSLPLLP